MTDKMTIDEYRKAKKRSPKYRNKKDVVDGIRFDSKKEANRYKDLKLLEKAGKIKNLQVHVAFPLTAYGEYICGYVADFVYQEENGQEVVEDTKGVRTKEYRIKAKLFYACYGKKILET